MAFRMVPLPNGPSTDACMRIAHVSPYYPPNRLGGVGEVVARLHSILLARGHTSYVVTSGSRLSEDHVHRSGGGPLSFAIRSLGSIRRLAGAEIVHFHHGEALPLLVLLRLRRRRPRVLLTLHVDNRRVIGSHRPIHVRGTRVSDGVRGWSQRFFKGPIKVILDRLALWMSDDVTFVSRAGAVEVLGAEKGRNATVIHNAVSPAPSTRVSEKPDWTDLIYVGSASLRKRTDLLPLILAEIVRIVPQTRLRIVGVNPDREPRMVENFRKLGVLDRVDWVGQVASGDVSQYYESSGILLLPSSYEGLPMVILEAMSHGLAVVAADVGGNSEAVEDGRSGRLVQQDDVLGFAEACLEMMRDDEWRSRGEEGRLLVSTHFSLADQVEEYLRVYGHLLTQSASD